MGKRSNNLTLTDRLEILDLEQAKRIDPDPFRLPFSPYVAGVEVTQAIQYYHASRHLTDPPDRGPDNSVGVVAYKPAWVRVYVRSGFYNQGIVLTGKIVVEQRLFDIPIVWVTVGEFTPQGSGKVTSSQSMDYATERGSLSSTLNFVLPADRVHGRMRIRAIIWPQGGSEESPSDTEEIYIDATLQQTLRVRGILVSYNGPNASGTVSNMNLAAPTVADLQSTCGNTFTVYPVQNLGVFSSGGTISWNTPLTGMATNPGGCSQQWLNLNVAVAQAKANDGNRTDVLYVGLLPSGIPIANVGGCNSSGVSAVPNGHQWTMAHELGHACGLSHAPCGTPGDPNYPAYEPYDPANSPTASLGEYGLDINTGGIHPPAEKDFMSYCGPKIWISLYHHGRLHANPALDPQYERPRGPDIPDLVDPWLWPWEYIPDPPAWELPSHFVKVAVQPVISLIGIVDLAGEVHVSSVMRVTAVAKLRQAVPTNLVAELIGAKGEVVARAPVMQSHAHGSGCGCVGDSHGHEPRSTGYAFEVMLPDLEPAKALRIVRIDPDGEEDAREVWIRKPAGGPPQVGEVRARLERGEAVLRWKARASRDQDLTFSIQFSKDKGKSWNGLVAGLREKRYRASIADMPSGSVVFRVLAHDGFFTTHAEARPIKLPPRPPVVSIVHPYDGRTYPAGTPLRLFAAVSTHVGARNPELKLEWQLDGKAAGTGDEVWINAARPGKHKCRVIARDDGGASEATATFVIEGKQLDGSGKKA